jgi:hypothetical protein
VITGVGFLDFGRRKKNQEEIKHLGTKEREDACLL